MDGLNFPKPTRAAMDGEFGSLGLRWRVPIRVDGEASGPCGEVASGGRISRIPNCLADGKKLRTELAPVRGESAPSVFYQGFKGISIAAANDSGE